MNLGKIIGLTYKQKIIKIVNYKINYALRNILYPRCCTHTE